MRDGEIEIRIPESIPLEQGGFSPHYPAVCGLCPFAMDTHLSWTKWHNAACRPLPFSKRLRLPCPATGKPHACWCVWSGRKCREAVWPCYGTGAQAGARQSASPALGKKLCPPGFPQSRRWHTFPVEFLLTTGILLLSNPGTEILSPKIGSRPSQEGPAKAQYACQYNDCLDNLAKGFRIHPLHDRHGKQESQYRKGPRRKAHSGLFPQCRGRQRPAWCR